jgi:hypothetical protein
VPYNILGVEEKVKRRLRPRRKLGHNQRFRRDRPVMVVCRNFVKE